MSDGADRLASARRTIESARAGADVTDRLVADLAAVQALPRSDQPWEVERVLRLALLASPHAPAIESALRACAPDAGLSLRGLMFRDDDPLRLPFPTNPWGIDSDMSLTAAIRQLWAGLHYAAPLVEALDRHLLGLALLDHERDRTPRLGYLYYHPFEDEGIDYPPSDRRLALAWENAGDVALFMGEAPAVAGAGVPAALAALYRVHGGMRDGMWSLLPPDGLLWRDILPRDHPALVSTEDPEEVRFSDQLLYFFSYGDDRSDLFDLAGGDVDDGGPGVRQWGEGWLHAGRPQPFAEWFADTVDLMVKTNRT